MEKHLFRHIPTKEESLQYFHQWLCEGPLSPRVNYFFMFLLGIHGISKVEFVEPIKRDEIRVVAHTHLKKMNLEAKEFEDFDEKYIIDIRFDDYGDEMDEFLLSFPQEKRRSLQFDPTKRGSMSPESREGIYRYETNMGIERVADILERCPSPNPANRFYEGCIAWIKSEMDKDLSDYNHIGDSSITIKRFVEDGIRPTIKKSLGSCAWAVAHSLDADTAKVYVAIPQDVNFDPFFKEGPWDVEIWFEFTLCLTNPIIYPTLSLGYNYREEESEVLSVKEREIHEFASKIVSKVQGLTAVACEEDREDHAFAMGDPYVADFSSQEGGKAFVVHILRLVGETFHVFKDFAEKGE